MSHRMESVWRVIAFLWAFVAIFILQFAIIVGIIVGAVDVLVEFILDRDFLPPDSSIHRVLRGLVLWPAMLLSFAITGDGGMMWTPDLS